MANRGTYQAGGLAAVVGTQDDDDEAPLTRGLIPSAMPKLDRSAAIERLTAARDRLMAQRQPDPSAKWLALAQGMLAPTRTGGFGESLGVTAGLLGQQRQVERQRVTAIDRDLLDAEIALERIAMGYGHSSAMREFNSLTEGMEPGDIERARRIELGLDPRAVGTGKITAATTQGLSELVADSEELIRERGKFGELTGSSRAKKIDSGFEAIQAINTNVRNMDRAIRALEGGASTGFVQQFLPSIREASIKLDQIQGELALDVVGATTFGALSKGELDLAKEVALPTALEPEELLQYLQERKIAQEKLKAYYLEQINFLDQGGTIAGFIRQKEREMGEGQPAPVPDIEGNLTGLSEEELDRQIEAAQVEQGG